MNITSVKLHKLENSTTLALAQITIDKDFVVSGLSIRNGRNGLFVSLPSRKDKEGDYHDIAFPITKESYQYIQDTVLNEYHDSTMKPIIDVPSDKAMNKIKGGSIDVTKDSGLPF